MQQNREQQGRIEPVRERREPEEVRDNDRGWRYTETNPKTKGEDEEEILEWKRCEEKREGRGREGGGREGRLD